VRRHTVPALKVLLVLAVGIVVAMIPQFAGEFRLS
jgi:hypothetical protein